MTRTPLAGFTIGVTADRRADEQIGLLIGRGAQCVHGPVIKTHPVEADSEIRAATQSVIARPPEIVVCTTGIGVRSWLEAADVLQIGHELSATLRHSELIARGPKVKGALVTAGFDVGDAAMCPRYDDVITALGRRDVAGRRIAVQLDGGGATELCARIASLGAEVIPTPVYRWSLPADVGPAERLIRAVVDRRVDALTFTARPAIENLFDIASECGLLAQLEDALRCDVTTVCVGAVCAAGLTEAGLPTPIVPERHRLGSMVSALAQHFAERRTTMTIGGQMVELQGRMLTIDANAPVTLSDRERSVLTALLERPGAVLSKQELLRQVWRGTESDVHLVEVTVGRLRQRLGPAASGVETVLRRGYRIAVS